MELGWGWREYYQEYLVRENFEIALSRFGKRVEPGYPGRKNICFPVSVSWAGGLVLSPWASAMGRRRHGALQPRALALLLLADADLIKPGCAQHFLMAFYF